MMLAFTNTQVTKQQLLDQLHLHALADEIVKGQYWEDGCGCAIGCAVHGSNHALYEPMFGIPEHLAHLEDAIFEGLPNDQAKLWPMQFTNAIQPGADLSRVWWQFSVWMLTDPEHGVRRFAGDPAWGVVAAIDQVAGLCARMVVGKPVADDDWSAARSAAWSAAESAAESAAWSAGWSAAWSATRSAGSVARSAARSAGSAAGSVWSAAESAAYIAMRDKLLELLAAAPVVQP